MFNQEKYNSELRSMYFHAYDQLEANAWDTTCEYKQDMTIWYDFNWNCVFVEEVYEDIGTTMRFEFHEDNHGNVTVRSCHKCNQPGCFFTELEYEGTFSLFSL